MFYHLEHLTPATLRTYAACMEHRRRLGHPPSARVVVQLAEAEGASPGACLVMVRHEVMSAAGESVPLNVVRPKEAPAGIVRDAETLWAILATGRCVTARLETPEGVAIPAHGREFERWVHERVAEKV